MTSGARWVANAMGLALAVAQAGAGAFEVEKPNAQQRFAMDGPIPVVWLGSDSFTVYEVPVEAPQLEISQSRDTYADVKASLTMGDPVTEAEALEVLEVYFKNTAFDFDSVKIRNFRVGQQTFVVWCGEWMLLCLTRKGGAGTWVEYEVNGRNRSGGMTGFRRSVVLMRKVPAAASVAAPPAAAASQ